MTSKDFEDFLVATRAQLMQDFAAGEVTDSDVTTKLILDYNEKIAKAVFKKLDEIDQRLTTIKGDLINDSKDRFKLLHEAIQSRG